MMSRRLWSVTSAVVVALFASACSDATGPLPRREVPGPQADFFSDLWTPCILQQASNAPPLETYQVSFWVRHDRESTVAVNYQSGEPYLSFRVPRFGLVLAPDGSRFQGSDSVLVTLTLDTVNLAVSFEPSGLVFSNGFPAQLTISYKNANPDVNRDGVVDWTDAMLKLRLALWGTSGRGPWFRVASRNNTWQQSVTGPIYHFSEYAVSW